VPNFFRLQTQNGNMERNANRMVGYSLITGDGIVGEIEEYYFDDETWAMRYLIIELEE